METATCPIINQESAPLLNMFQQLNLAKLHTAQKIQQTLTQQTLTQQPPLSSSQLLFAQLLANNQTIDGKIAVDPMFLQNLMTQNEMMKLQMNSLIAQREKLMSCIRQHRYNQLNFSGKQNTPKMEKTDSEKKKRFRRAAKSIARMFECPAEKCYKSYGSEGSLHQHIRLKHPEFDLLSWIQSKLPTEQDKTQEMSQENELSNTNSCSESNSINISQLVKQEREALE